jgi:hypothetical protein
MNMDSNICGGREKVGKSNNLKNELTMFTPSSDYNVNCVKLVKSGRLSLHCKNGV